MFLIVEEIVKHYDGVLALNRISLQVERERLRD